MRTTTPASTWAVMTACGRVDDLAGELDPAVDRARVHEHLARVQAPAVDLVLVGVLAQGRHEGLVHALVLHAQGVDDVGLGQVVEGEAHVAAERLDAARDQRRRPADGDPGAHLLEGEDVRARHARVQDVADDPDAQAVEAAQALAQGVDVEQRLSGVLVLAVAGVDDRRRRPLRDERGRPRPRGADDDGVGLVGVQGQDGVLQRLALLHARPAGREVHDVGAQALGRELEGRARARRGLVEEVQDGAPAQGRDLLDLAVGDLGERGRPVADALDRGAIEILDGEQVPHVSHLRGASSPAF